MPISKRIHKNGSVAFQATDRTPHFTSLSKTFATRRGARDWLATIHGERRRGLNYDPKQNESMTLGEAIQKYTEMVTPKKKGADQELAMAKRWLRHPFANRPIGEILPFEFDQYVEFRLADGKAGSTILKELSLVSQVYGFVRKKLRMYAVVNPIVDVDKPAPGPPRSRRLTVEEEAKLLAFFEAYGNRYLAAAFIFAVETGLRKSELLRLQWERVDLAGRWATVEQAQKGRNPATQAKYRGFPLTERALAVLYSIKAATGGQLEGAVFKTTADAIDCARKDALKATGVLNWWWHDARHETASRLAVRGVGQELIKQMLGHKNLKMTADYQTFSRSELVNAVK